MPSDPTESVSDTPPAKPGYLTTEFWKSGAVTVVSLLVGLGIITPDQQTHASPWIAGIALGAAAISTGLYSISRGKTKAAAVEAAANVVIADKHIAGQLTAMGLTQQASAPVATSEQVQQPPQVQ